MAARSVKIANVDGTTTKTFSQLYVQNPYPEFNFETGVASTQMRSSSTSRGNRVWTAAGTTVNHWDVDVTLNCVANADRDQLRTWAQARPPVVLFSLDGGVTRYFAIIRTIEVNGYRSNEDPDNPNPFFSQIVLGLSVLTSTSTAFGS